MTIVACPAFHYPNGIWTGGTVGTSLSATATACATIDAASEAMAVVFQCPVGGSLTDIGYRTATTAVTAGPLNFDVRLETVSNGKPTGTLWSTTTNYASSVADTDDNVWKTGTLTSAATVAQGDFLAIVIKSPGSGTFSLTWGGFTNWAAPSSMFPTCLSDINVTPDGVYETLNTAGAPSFDFKISGVWYRADPWMAQLTATINSVTSASSPDEYAMSFVPPVGMRVKGAALYLSNIAAAGDFTVSLWPSASTTDGNALVQKVFDGDIIGSTTTDGVVNVIFPTSQTLTAGAQYYLGVRADTANAVGIPSMTVTQAAHMDATPWGQNMAAATRTWTAGSTSTFSIASSTAVFFALLVDGLDLPATGGGIRIAGHGGLAA